MREQAERAAQAPQPSPSGDPARDSAPGRGADGAAERPAVRHCWVRAADGGPPWPGIVVAWVRGPHGWRGRVVYVVPGAHGQDPVLVEAWVEAPNLRPVAPAVPRDR